MTTSNRLTVSVGHLSSPTSQTWNNIVAGMLTPGVYSGGQVIPGTGLNVKVEPFVARNFNQTLRLEGDDYLNVPVPKPGALLMVVHSYRTNVAPEVTEIEFISPSALTDDMVVLCQINTPLGAVQITEDMIDTSMVVRKSLDSDTIFGRVRSGTNTFKTDNVIKHKLGHQNYTVSITPLLSELSIGDVAVVKGDNEFVVTNTGPSTGKFDWQLTIRNDGAEVNGIVYGQMQAIPAGITVKHRIGNPNYFPVVIPVETPPGGWWVEKNSDDMIVHSIGGEFRCIWAAIPTQSTHINGRSDYSATEIVHNLGHKKYRLFHTSLAANNPTDVPVFEKLEDRVLIHSNSNGPFQYLIVEDSQGLAGSISFGQKANHFLNREDYLPLIQPLTAVLTSVTQGRNSIFSNENVDVDYWILPANNSWALGDWTRPASTPITSRIEVDSTIYSDAVQGSIVYREICSQDNFITRALARLAPVQALGQTISLTLLRNGQDVATIAIPGTQTKAVEQYVPIRVAVGDMLEVRLNTVPPAGALSFNFYGQGTITVDGEGEVETDPPALRIVRVRLNAPPAGKRDFEVPVYIPGSNNLTVIVDDRELLLTHSEYEELDETHIRTALPYNDTNKIEVQVVGQLYPVEAAIGPNPGITPKQASQIEQNRINVEAVTQAFNNYVNTFEVSREDIEALGSLNINIVGRLDGDSYGTHTGDVIGNVQGSVTGSAGSLAGLNYSVSFMNTFFAELSSGENSGLHFHASDRDRTNHTGTQLLNTIRDAGTLAARNAGNDEGQVPLLDSAKQFPLLAVSKALPSYFPNIGSQADMLALSSAKRGDYAKRTDLNATFVLIASDPSVAANWINLGGAASAGTVKTVSGRGPDANGNIDLVSSDIQDFNDAVETATNLFLDDAITNNQTVQDAAAKEGNATHTGDVTGSHQLTIATGAVTAPKLSAQNGQNLRVLAYSTAAAGNLAWAPVVNSINGQTGPLELNASFILDFSDAVNNLIETNPVVMANTAKEGNATHTGEVTGSKALTISNNVISLSKLRLNNSPIDGQFIQIDLSAPSGLRVGEPAGLSIDGAIGSIAFTEVNEAQSLYRYGDYMVDYRRIALSDVMSADVFQAAAPLAATIAAEWTGRNVSYTPGSLTSTPTGVSTPVNYVPVEMRWKCTAAATNTKVYGTLLTPEFKPIIPTTWNSKWIMGANSATDGAVGVVLIALRDEDDSHWKTVSFVRSPGGAGFTARIIYQWGASDEAVLADLTEEFKWGNGNYGATAAEAGYVAATGWNTFANSGAYVEIDRRGNRFSIRAADLSANAVIAVDPVVSFDFDLEVVSNSDVKRSTVTAGLGMLAFNVGQPFWKLDPSSGAFPTAYARLTPGTLANTGQVYYDFSGTPAWKMSADPLGVLEDLLRAGRIYKCPVTHAVVYSRAGLEGDVSLEKQNAYRVISAGVYRKAFNVPATSYVDFDLSQIFGVGFVGEADDYLVQVKVQDDVATSPTFGKYINFEGTFTVMYEGNIVRVYNESAASKSAKIVIHAP